MTKDEITEIVDLYADMIKRICFTYMKSESDADDIMQTVFVKLIQSDMVFDHENHRKAWIIRVTINSCKDSLKSYFRKNVISIEEYKNQYIEYAQNDKESYNYDSLLDTLWELPSKYRIILYLFYFEEYSAKEISNMMNIGENTVFTRLKRGRDLMKKRMGENWYE